ncbi:MAG: MFS transporter [Caulobacteraceae bacterium]
MKHTSKLVQYIGFISVGIIANIIGPLLPAIRTDISINYSQGGLLLSVQFIGMLVTSMIGGYFMDRSGKGPFMLAGSALIIAGLVGCMTAGSYISLYVLNLVTGFGYGIYETGINALCADSSEENKGSDMNFVHFFYGVGAIIAPLIAWFSTDYLGNWRYCFGFALIAPVIVSILLLSNKIEEHKTVQNRSEQSENKGSNPLSSLFLWTAGFAMFFYVGVEVSTGGWITVFWNTLVPGSIIPASITATIFWLFLTVGRLISGRIADHIGLTNYMLAASIGTLLLTVLWSVLPSGIWTLIIVALLGILLSGQFPTAMAVSTAHFPGKTGMTAAFISVFAGLGGFFIPSVIGRLADTFSISILPYAVLALSVLLVTFTIFVRKGSKVI